MRVRNIKPKAVTGDQLRAMMEQAIEPTEPALSVYRILAENDGKRADKRLIDKIKAATGLDFVVFLPSASMMYLEFGPYHPQRGRDRFFIAHSIKNVRIDRDFIFKQNGRYLWALDERNEKRREILSRPEQFDVVAAASAEYAAAHKKLSDALDQVYGDLGDRYAAEEAIGWMEGS